MQNNDLYRYNLSNNNCIDEIKEIIEKNIPFYNRARIRLVVIKNKSDSGIRWLSVICRIKIFTKDEKIEKRDNIIYDDIKLSEYWLDIETLLKLIGQFPIKEVNINEEIISFDRDVGFYEIKYQPHHNDYSDLPGYLYNTSQGYININLPNHPLLAYNSPYFPDINAAIAKWCGILDFNGSHDGRIGMISLFLPETRAFIDFLYYDDKEEKFIIKIKNNINTNLYLKGMLYSPYGYSTIDNRVDSNNMEYTIKPEVIISIQTFELFLVDEQNNILDYHVENRYSGRYISRVNIALPIDKGNGTIKQAIEKGECDNVEFKPYVKPGDLKFNEIIETVISFANTIGGNIYLGVNKYAEPEGVERDIHILANQQGESYDTTIKTYCGLIRKKIADMLNRNPEYSVKNIKEQGHEFIVIEISEGNQKPYVNVNTNEIYIRRGSNNVRPNPDMDLPKLLGISE